MANTRFAPDFRIHINDAPVPAAVRAAITSVTFQAGLEGSDRVEMSLVNDKLRWLDNPLFALDNRLKLSIGYAPTPLTQVFVGNIVSHTATFPSSGVPTLTVISQDQLERLQQGGKVRWFAIPTESVGNFPIPDQNIAELVSAEQGLLPIFDPVGAALAVILGGVDAVVAMDDPDMRQKLIRKQANESDYSFLQRIAGENGWELFIEHGEPLGGSRLRFFSALGHLSPDLTLEYGRSLIDFSPRISNVGQVISVTCYVWIAQIKQSFSITVGWNWDRMALELDVKPSSAPVEKGPAIHVIEEPLTLASAPRVILSQLLPKLNRRLTGTGSTVGDPTIKPGNVIELKGLGRQFSGLYRVTSVTQTINTGGFLTNFEVRKEVWFGSLPPIKADSLARVSTS